MGESVSSTQPRNRLSSAAEKTKSFRVKSEIRKQVRRAFWTHTGGAAEDQEQMRSTYLRASFTCLGGAQEETGDLVVNAELCQDPGFPHNRRAERRLGTVRHVALSMVEILLRSSCCQEVSGQV